MRTIIAIASIIFITACSAPNDIYAEEFRVICGYYAPNIGVKLTHDEDGEVIVADYPFRFGQNLWIPAHKSGSAVVTSYPCDSLRL